MLAASASLSAASISSAVGSADRSNLPSSCNFDETFVIPSSWHNVDLNPVVFALAAPHMPLIWSNATTESNPESARCQLRRKRSRASTASSPLAAAASSSRCLS